MGRIAAIDGKLQVMNDVGQEIPNVSTCFLTAFKTKDNLADKFILMGGKDACRRKGHGHMAIVPAGVTDTGDLGNTGFGFLQVFLTFLNGKRVCITAHEEGSPLFPAVKDGQKAPVRDIHGFKAEALEIRFEEGNGLFFFIA